MAAANKNSTLFGLVLIPTGLYKSIEEIDIPCNRLVKGRKTGIRFKKYCNPCNKKFIADMVQTNNVIDLKGTLQESPNPPRLGNLSGTA